MASTCVPVCSPISSRFTAGEITLLSVMPSHCSCDTWRVIATSGRPGNTGIPEKISWLRSMISSMPVDGVSRFSQAVQIGQQQPVSGLGGEGELPLRDSAVVLRVTEQPAPAQQAGVGAAVAVEVAEEREIGGQAEGDLELRRAAVVGGV